MRIVLSSKRFLPIWGGSVQYLVMLARAFRSQGHQVTLVTRTPGEADEVEGCPVMRLPSHRELLRLAATTDVLLQVDASWRDAWPFLLHRVPWFPTLHFGYPVGKIPLRKRIALAGLGVAFRIGHPIAVGHEVARSWGIRGLVIPNPYDNRDFHPPAAEAPRDVDVLFVGRLEWGKGLFVLLDALEILVRERLQGPIHCVFVGDGPEENELASRMQGCHPQLQMTLAGRHDSRGVADWMRRSKVLAFPTTRELVEASPLTPLEALACGCKIVASDNGGTRENIGPQGVLVPMDDAPALARALLESLTSPELTDYSAIDAFLAPRRLDVVAARYLAILQPAP